MTSSQKLSNSASAAFCFHFSCSKPSNTVFFCPSCPKIFFCSLKCQQLHQKETHQDLKKDSSAKKMSITGEMQEDYEIIASLANVFQPKDPPFEGVSKEFYRVKRRKSGKSYIMIIIKKADLPANTIEQILLACLNHKKLSHPHLLKLFKLCDEKTQISCVYETFTPRTLAALLKHKKTLMERNAFIYFTQICLAVDYLHKNGFSSLNLALANFMLDEKLDLKISDYNFPNPNSIQNMAPETVQNPKPSEKSDCWTLGVLLFEMIHGYFPYKGKNVQERTANILIDNRKKFASFISDEAQDLLSKALCRNPQGRIGLGEIFKHKWMEKFYKLFNVDIEKFQQPEKKSRSSLINQKRKSAQELEKVSDLPERKTMDVLEKKEVLPLRIFAEEFSFRLQNVKLRSSFDIQNSQNNPNLKSFTFHKSSSPSSNPNMTSSLMKSSDNSGKNKEKMLLDECVLDRKTNENEDLLKLQRCEGSQVFEDGGFWRKFTNVVGCGCFSGKK